MMDVVLEEIARGRMPRGCASNVSGKVKSLGTKDVRCSITFMENSKLEMFVKLNVY